LGEFKMVRFESRIIECEDSIDAIYDLFYKEGLTDGLPIIPPTKEAVKAMMATVDRAPSDLVGNVPPRNAPGTIEKLAINAVMAGCLPSYFPIIVAATEALCDPKLNFYSIATTTASAATMLIINGPIRQTIDLNCGWDVMGPGNRANSTIGRAVSLIELNIGGRTAGVGSKCVIGQPGRSGWCIGEREEESPWEPLHVERGFKPDDSVATIIAVSGILSHEDHHSGTAEGLLRSLAGACHFSSSTAYMGYWGIGESGLVMCPTHAQILAKGGLSKQDVKQQLYERTLDTPLSWIDEYHVDEMRAMDREEVGPHVHGSRPEMIRLGLIKPGQVQITEKGAAMAARPDQFMIVVAGGDAGYQSAFLPCFGDNWAVSRRIIL
jgi:hypothetical protein